VGHVSDHIVVKWCRQHNGIWYPEDRMRAAIIPFTILVPISVLCFGLVNKFIDGNVLFFNGGGVSETKQYSVYKVDMT